jgi:hypothetical protein
VESGAVTGSAGTFTVIAARRLVVEQNDRFFADVNERDFLVGDRGEIKLDVLVVSEIDDDRLIGQRLRQLINSRRSSSVAGISRPSSQSNLKWTVHGFARDAEVTKLPENFGRKC